MGRSVVACTPGRHPQGHVYAQGSQTTKPPPWGSILLQEIPGQGGQKDSAHHLSLAARSEIYLVTCCGGHRTETPRGTLGSSTPSLSDFMSDVLPVPSTSSVHTGQSLFPAPVPPLAPTALVRVGHNVTFSVLCQLCAPYLGTAALDINFCAPALHLPLFYIG